MKDIILIPFGSKFLALTEAQFKEAMARGKEMVGEGRTKSHSEKIDVILDAEGMREKTGIPSTWFLEAARQGRVPFIRAGKYVRFRMEEVIKVLEERNGHKARRNFSRK